MTNQSSPAPEGAKSDLEKRLEQLQTELSQSKQATTEAQHSLEVKTKEAKQHQAERDRITQKALAPPVPQRPGLQRPPTTTPPGARGQVPTQSHQEAGEIDLREFANAQAKEIMLLREVMARGLTMEEVDDLEYSTPAELKLQLELLQQKKELASLKQQIEEGKEGAPKGPTSTLKVDTGGPTGTADSGDQVLAMRKTAADLRAKGQYREATWVTLELVKQEQLLKLQRGG